MFGTGPNLQDSYYVRADGVTQTDNSIAVWNEDTLGDSLVLIDETGNVTAVKSISIVSSSANPGGASTLWLNTSDGSLYLGPSKITTGGGDVSSNTITSTTTQITRFANTTGKLITSAGLNYQQNLTTGSMYFTCNPLSSVTSGTSLRNVVMTPNIANTRPNMTGADNTVYGAICGDLMASANKCTIIGARSGSALTTQNDCTFTGYNCGVNCIANFNTFYGSECGKISVGSNTSNTAFGSFCLIGGSNNSTAMGADCCNNATNVINSVCNGNQCCRSVTLVNESVCLGYQAGFQCPNTVNSILIGASAGANCTSLTACIFIGRVAGSLATTNSSCIYIGDAGAAGESNTTRIGSASQTKCYIHGIYNRTTSGVATNVVIDSTGNVGTISSSMRYKENIREVEDDFDLVYKLSPKQFNYKQKAYECIGLIAEEVEEVMPSMVIRDEKGQPDTVNYLRLPIMMLGAIKQQKSVINQLENDVMILKKQMAEVLSKLQ